MSCEWNRNDSITPSFPTTPSLTGYIGEGTWYQLVTLHTHGDFIVLLHWEFRLMSPWPDTNPTQYDYPDTVLTSPFSILLMPSSMLGGDKYQFDKPLIWIGWNSNARPSAREAYALLIQPPHPVSYLLPMDYLIHWWWTRIPVSG